MKLTRTILSGLLGILLFSCEKNLFEPDPAGDPEAVFEALWNTYNTDYAVFEHRGVDWQEQYDLYRPRVNPNTSDEALQAIIREMLTKLNDLHVKFMVPGKEVFKSNLYQREKIGDELFDLELITDSYITGEVRVLGYDGIVMGWIGQTGYVHFKWISDNFLSMDEVLDYFAEADGLIIDLRHNGGGDFTWPFSEMGRLTDEERFVFRSKTKNGPGKDDFTRWYDWNIYPSGSYFDKPLVLLTDRYTGSAAERYTMALRTLPNLVHMGDTTNGAFSTMIGREMVNGWSFTVATQVIEFRDGHSYEGTGMIPDILVENSPEEMEAGTDRTLETALEHLR